MIRFISAGESHGEAIIGICEGFPAGVRLDVNLIDRELGRRKACYGRSSRCSSEPDRASIIGGVKDGISTGAPLAIIIKNHPGDPSDYKPKGSFVPRPGHADLTGYLKYGHSDVTVAAERSGGRETAARVAVGAALKQLLNHLDITIFSHTTRIGSIKSGNMPGTIDAIISARDSSSVYCPDAGASALMMDAIDKAAAAGDTLGGAFIVQIHGVPPGLGTYNRWDGRLDARLMHALGSIPGIKAVEVGEIIDLLHLSGRQYHDRIFKKGKARLPARSSNRAGGIEGGISNGMPITLRAFVKPVPTLSPGLESVDVRSDQPAVAPTIRSDTCVVPAASVVGEAMAAMIISDALAEKFGGDNLEEIKRNLASYLD